MEVCHIITASTGDHVDQAVITTPPTTASQIYDWLRRRVQTTELPPGARISETEIAAEIGISRQPVREAFIRLAADGLAEVKPQRGTYIGKISVGSVLSARLIREAVESDLAKMVALLRPKDGLAAMQAEIDLQKQHLGPDDVERFVESDDRFHRQLAIAAGHEAVWNDLERLKAQINRLRHLSMRVFDRQHTIDQHQRILDTLTAGDGSAAEAAVRAHLRQILDDMPQIRQAQPEFFTD